MAQTDKKRLLVVMDWQPPSDWAFKIPLQRYFVVDVLHNQAPKNINSTWDKVFKLWMSYAVASVRAFVRLKRYNVVYSWHAVIGLFLAFWCRVLHISSPDIVLAQVILPERGDNLAQRLRRWFVSFCLKRIAVVVVYSSVEVEKYERAFGNGITRFVFVPLGIEIPEATPAQEQPYLFSGGRSNRDYLTLIQAVRNIDVPLTIVAQKYNIPEGPLPQHIDVRYGVFGDEFDRLLAQAALVVIPLERPDESSGQLVLLRAMAFGKAIIVTANRGIEDYIQDGENVCVVPPHDVEGLERAIVSLMNSPEERQRLGAAARQQVKRFSISQQAETIADLLYQRAYSARPALFSPLSAGHHET